MERTIRLKNRAEEVFVRDALWQYSRALLDSKDYKLSLKYADFLQSVLSQTEGCYESINKPASEYIVSAQEKLIEDIRAKARKRGN